MIPLFLLSIFISNHLEIYSFEGKTYTLSNHLSIQSYLNEDFLYLLGFLFFFQTLYHSWYSFRNILLLSSFLDLNYINTHDTILFQITQKDFGYYITRKDISFFTYIVLSFLLSKFELFKFFLFILLKKYYISILDFIDHYYPMKEYYTSGIQKGKEFILYYKQKMMDKFIHKKEE